MLREDISTSKILPSSLFWSIDWSTSTKRFKSKLKHHSIIKWIWITLAQSSRMTTNLCQWMRWQYKRFKKASTMTKEEFLQADALCAADYRYQVYLRNEPVPSKYLKLLTCCLHCTHGLWLCLIHSSRMIIIISGRNGQILVQLVELLIIL